MKNFGYPHILKELNGSNGHRLQNVLLMEPSLRVAFDTLLIW